MIGFHGIISKRSACILTNISFQPIIEAVDVGKIDVFKRKDPVKEFKEIAE